LKKRSRIYSIGQHAADISKQKKIKYMESRFETLMGRTIRILTMAGINPAHVTCSQYDIILEADLKMVQDRVVFRAIGFGVANGFITEIKLNQRDSFVFDEWGLFLLNTDGPEDVKFGEHTFADPLYFEKEERVESGVFYNSNLTMWVNNELVIPDVRTDVFRYYETVKERGRMGISGLIGLKIPMLMIGSKNVNFNLDLPRKTTGWVNSETRLRLRLRGILLMNTTVLT
jgi:hypothetical protein